MSNLTCRNCHKKFNFYDKYDYKIYKTYCTNCNHEYTVLTDSDEAVSSSDPGIIIKFHNDNTLIETYFDNIPRDTLNKAFREHKSLNTFEANPKKLLIPLKIYHDALRKRVHRFVAIKHKGTSISDTDRENISKNTNGHNLETLLDLLPEAIPSKRDIITNYLNRRRKTIKQIMWIRNKEDHLNTNKWTIPTYIHTKRKFLPSDKSRIKLNYKYLKKINNFVISIFLFLIRIDPIRRSLWEYQAIRNCKIMSNY